MTAGPASAPSTELHAYGEDLARRRVRSGRAGDELTAVLLDLLDAERTDGPVGAHNWRIWAVAAGFADGPELDETTT